MGLDLTGLRFLLYARSLGADFDVTATIGRQGLELRPRPLQKALASHGIATDAAGLERILRGTEGYAEELLRRLGSRTVHVLDLSPYEGATHLHDLNRPIADNLKDSYSVVLDGGSLEHVFNFPVAIRNCMEMVKVGGHFLSITPANNFMGHGFYQFSPELYYNVFRRENGYEMVRLVLCETRPGATWYAVKDPHVVRKRVVLTNSAPVHLLVVARRVAKTPIFETTPQQSDYRVAWANAAVELRAPAAPARPRRSWRRRARTWIKEKARRLRTAYDPRFYEAIDPEREARAAGSGGPLNPGGR